MKSGEIRRHIKVAGDQQEYIYRNLGFISSERTAISALATEALELRRRLAKMIRHVRTVASFPDGREHRNLAECWLEDERRELREKRSIRGAS